MRSVSNTVRQEVESFNRDITQHGENIVGRKVSEFNCFGCGEVFRAEIQATGVHKKNCLWNYFVECNKCHYQNNLAKYASVDCICRKTI